MDSGLAFPGYLHIPSPGRLVLSSHHSEAWSPLTIALSPSNSIMLRFWRYALVGVISTCAVVQAVGEDDDDPTMGPAAFMWPSDRPWSADVDNVAPCGSSAGVGNRTNYPLCTSRVWPFSPTSVVAGVLT